MRKLLFISFLLIVACTKPPSEEDILLVFERKISIEVDRLKKEKIKDCTRVIMSDATAAVDSMLVRELDLDLLDSVEMIEKPFRPERPSYIRDIDTSKISPIFDTIVAK